MLNSILKQSCEVLIVLTVARLVSNSMIPSAASSNKVVLPEGWMRDRVDTMNVLRAARLREPVRLSVYALGLDRVSPDCWNCTKELPHHYKIGKTPAQYPSALDFSEDQVARTTVVCITGHAIQNNNEHILDYMFLPQGYGLKSSCRQCQHPLWRRRGYCIPSQPGRGHCWCPTSSHCPAIGSTHLVVRDISSIL